MYHFLGKKATIKPDFPERLDMAHLSDKEAHDALELLRLLVSGGQADVYTRPWREPGQRWRWSVWVQAESRRYDLETWAISVLFPPITPSGGDAA